MQSKQLFCLMFIFSFFSAFSINIICNTNGFYADFSSADQDLADKIEPSLQTLLNNYQIEESSVVRIIVTFRNPISWETVIEKITSFSPDISLIRSWNFISSAVFEVPINYIKIIASLSEIKAIWLDREFQIPKFNNNHLNGEQITEILDSNDNVILTGKNSENFTKIYNGTNIIVALLDTGIDIFHPDLTDSILAFGGVSMVDGDPFPLDFNGHGTFCAGIITGNGVINSSIKGVAPGADILNIKVLSYLGIGLWSWIISGIEYAIIHGADIIAMCFSMPGYPQDPVNLAIDSAIQRGMIVVAAVGDDGPAYSSVNAPGMAQGALTVGAYNDLTQQVASFSGRGPTLSLNSKPDLLASGVNIVSCRPSFSSNLPINITDLIQGTSDFGIPIDGNYTMISGTHAAAANVSGAIASLLQHSKFLSAEEIKIILQETATPLPNIPQNVQGAGIVNLNKAHLFLTETSLNDSLTDRRLFTPTFLSPGYIISQNTSRNISAFVTNYGSILAIVESTQNFVFTHMIQGVLGVKYNNHIKWLSEMYILRESHNLTPEFSIIQSVITDYSIICVISVESWPSINGFRLNLTIINLEPQNIYNVSVYSLWDTNLFNSQSNQGSNDFCTYNSSDDIIYVHDSKNSNSSYIGFTGSISSNSHEINSSSNIRNQIQQGSLLNNDASAQNLSIAMEWNLLNQLNSSKFTQFSQYIGIENSYLAVNYSIQSIKRIQSFDNYSNLAILSSNLSRIGFVNQPFSSRILIMNLGNVPINDTITAFLINSTNLQTQTFFSKYIQVGRLNPFEFKWINASWNPTDADIYSTYWMVGTQTLINQLILYFLKVISVITMERNYLDNFFARNIFIKDINLKMHSIFPNLIPIAPQLILFPNDNAIFNLTVTTNHPLNNIQLSFLEGNLPLNWISFKFPFNIQNFASIQIIISIPQTPRVGSFYQRVNISTPMEQIGEIWINFSVNYPSARILFYKPTINFDFQSISTISDLYNLWNERLDTIYSGYFDLYNLCLSNNYDIDDFSILKQFYPNFSLDTTITLPFKLPYSVSSFQQNSTFISNYDLIVICDPDIDITQTEINTLTQFCKQGGSLFFWLEPETESQHTSINSILNQFGIQIKNSFNSIENQTLIKSPQYNISSDISQIRLYSFVTFENSSNSTILTSYNNEPTILINDSFGKLLCVGDSSLFNSTCIFDADNFPFLNNSINWLLQEKINISIYFNKENQSETLRLGRHLSLSIHLTLIDGSEFSGNSTLYSVLITPSNRLIYMILFHVQAGWYNTIYLSEWLNETGSYNLIIYANSPSKVSSYAIEEFILEESSPTSTQDPNVDLNWARRRWVFWGMITAFIITNIIIGIFFYQRRQWKRQMSIMEIKEKLKREISNLLSEYKLYVKEIEELLAKKEVFEPDKLKMVLDKQERKKQLLDKLKKLGKKV